MFQSNQTQSAPPATPRGKRRRVMLRMSWLGLGVSTLVAGVWLLGGPSVDDGVPRGLHWKPGYQYGYALTYRAKDRVDVGAALMAGRSSPKGAPKGPGTNEQAPPPAGSSNFAGDFELAGRLVLKAYGREGKQQVLGLRLEQITRHRFMTMGQDLLPDEAAVKAAFGGQEALLGVEPSGRVQRLHFDDAAPPLFRQTVAAIVGETIVNLRPGKRSWNVTEKTTRGSTETAYELQDVDRQGFTVGKRRDHYDKLTALLVDPAATDQSVASSATIVVGVEGQLERFSAKEEIEVFSPTGEVLISSRSTAALALQSVDRFSESSKPLALAAAVRARMARANTFKVGEPTISEPAREALLGRIVGGMTIDSLSTLLRGIRQPNAQLPKDFLWRARALLEMDPEHCDAIGRLFAEPDSSSRARLAMVGLLATVGSGRAQRVLRDILRSTEAQADAAYSSMLSKLTFVRRPDNDTLALLQDGHDGAQGRARVASTLALGAAIAHAHATADSERALVHNDSLLQDLRSSSDPRRQRELLLGLGNAGLKQNVGAIVDYARSEDPSVRRAAAAALRKTQTAEGERLLLDLAGDDQTSVQHAAISSLGRYVLQDTHFESLLDAVEAGRLHEQSYLDLLGLLTRQAAGGQAAGGQAAGRLARPAVHRILRAMLDQPINRPDIRRAVQRTLKSAG